MNNTSLDMIHWEDLKTRLSIRSDNSLRYMIRMEKIPRPIYITKKTIVWRVTTINDFLAKLEKDQAERPRANPVTLPNSGR